MPNNYFRFKEFTIHQEFSAMKVTTEACLFGAWVAENLRSHLQHSCKALDIGAGTGLLSLMLAQTTSASFTSVEIDPGAATQAGENISKS